MVTHFKIKLHSYCGTDPDRTDTSCASNKRATPCTPLFRLSCTGRESRTPKILILNQPRLPFRHSCIFCGSSKIRTYSVQLQQIYSLPQPSNFGVLPFCPGSRIRTCDLLHPKQANSHRYLPGFNIIWVFSGNRTRELRNYNPGFYHLN